MKLLRAPGATSQILQIFIADSSSTVGAGLSGLTNATSGLIAYYHRDTDTTATAISLVSMTVGTFTSSGFAEIDATHMKGWYQFCPPNAALASGASSAALHLQGAANMAELPIEIDLAGPGSIWDITTAAHTTAGTFGGSTITAPTNFGALSISGSGVVSSNITQWNATAVRGTIPPDVNLNYTGTSSFTGSTTTITMNGAVATDNFYNNQIVVLTGGSGAGQSATITSYVGATKIATINGTWATLPDGTTTFAVIAGGAVGAVASVTGNVSGNVVGSVGSVTGAVGSVTGAVGSVTGAVGSVTGNVTGSIGSLGATAKTDVSTAVLTTQMTESYAALHAVPTLAQSIFEMRGFLVENTVAATTVTVKKIDGSTTAETATINSSSAPTSITRAS